MSISNELLNNCRKLLENKFNKEFIEEKENNDNFIKALINTDNFNIFYSMLEDDYSKKIFTRIVRYRYMLAFYNDAYINIKEKIKLSIKYGVINIFSWSIKRMLFFLNKHKYPREIENFLLFYIFGLEQYNLKDVFEVRMGGVIYYLILALIKETAVISFLKEVLIMQRFMLLSLMIMHTMFLKILKINIIFIM